MVDTETRTWFSPHCTVYPDREKWLAARRHSLGASEAWSVLSGQGASEVWLRKTRPEDAVSPVSELDSDVAHAMEPVIAAHYAQQTGHTVHDPGDYASWHHPDIPYLTATPDRLVERQGGMRGLLEGKTCSRWLLPVKRSPYSGWEERAPYAHATQAAMQMLVMDEEVCDLFAIVMDKFPREKVLRPVWRSWRFEELLLEKCTTFWERYVQRDTPPPAGPDPSAERVLRLLYPDPEPDRVYVLPSERIRLAEQWDELAATEKEAKEGREAVRRELMQQMADADICEDESGERLFTWRKTKSGSRTFRRSESGKKG